EGYLLFINVKEGPVPVNAVLAVIGGKDEDYKAALASASSTPATEPAAKSNGAKEDKTEKSKATSPVLEEKVVTEVKPVEPEAPGRILTSPLARSMATDAGINLLDVKGSGDGGRIIKRDIENYVASGTPVAAKTNIPATPQYGDVPISQMRKTIARRLVESKFSAPHFYLTMKINMDRAWESRKTINDQNSTKISFNDLVIKACAAALKQHPAVNTSWLGDKIRYNKDINIGVAVAVDEGLLVPVLFAADKMGLNEINATVTALADKARNKKLQPQEMQGNTFTVSNLGMFGIDEFTAIINPPDAAILAIGTIADELYMQDGAVKSAKIMKVTMSCDHRVVDGATGAKFLQTFKQFLENPLAMLL
ncbi:MAG TPA: dihydrolipoamide acetyltransferase family protein, partial [Saprospiraceae bacterium]|nr:dihydrolipoamide acetyltransferase family protein [Saprospiraceae bacterium]